MTLSKRTTLLLLVVVILLSIALRYPTIEHERFQADSYSIHLLSQSIVNKGYAIWTFTSFSYLGYYPLSYPSGVPFVLAEMSILTGLDVEVCILLIGALLGIAFVFAVFCLAREFMIRTEFVVLATLLATLGPRFLDNTYWVGSARGTLVLMMTLALFIALRATTQGNNRLLSIGILIGLTCFAVHHMAILFVLLGGGFVLATLIANSLVTRAKTHKAAIAFAACLGTGLIFSILAFTYVMSFGESIEATFADTYVFRFKPMIVSMILNVAVSYTHQMGLMLPLALLGILWLFRGSRFSSRILLPVTIVLAFVPLLGSSLYLSLVLLPMVAILASKYISRHYAYERRRRFVAAGTCCMIVFSVALAVWSIPHWNSDSYQSGDRVVVENDLFTDATYLKVNLRDKYLVSNNMYSGILLGVGSDTRLLWEGLDASVNGDISAADIRGNVSWSGQRFPTNMYIWLQYDKDVFIVYSVQGLMYFGVKSLYGESSASTYARDYFADHSKLVVAVDQTWPSSFVSYYGFSPATFISELRNSEVGGPLPAGADVSEFGSYMVFGSARYSFYLVQLPS